MRTLLILGGLVVCVLLVTPSNGDQTESQDGGEKGTSDLREFFGQNEDGKANGIDAGSSSAIDQRLQLRSRRQEPSSPRNPSKRKKCPGCFSSLSVDDSFRLDVPKRSRRQEKKDPSSPSTPRKRKKCSGCFSAISSVELKPIMDPIRFEVHKRSRRQEKKEPSSSKNPSKRKKCPGCFSSLIVTDPSKLSKRARRQDKKTSRDTKPKRSKKMRVLGTDGLEGKPKSDRPSRRKSKKSEAEQSRPTMFGLMSAPQPDFSTLEKTPKDEGRRERKKNGRKHSREEKEERKMRKHHHHHHHHHPEGEKEEKGRKHTGFRSPITSTNGRRKEDLDDGKEVSERMKRQSGKGNRRKEKERWTVGSRSPIASLPG